MGVKFQQPNLDITFRYYIYILCGENEKRGYEKHSPMTKSKIVPSFLFQQHHLSCLCEFTCLHGTEVNAG
jgi:hypothetical protein